MEIFKIIAIGLLTCIIAIIVKQLRPEFYVVIILIGGIVIMLMLIGQLQNIFNYFLELFNKINIDISYFTIVLKIVGIGYLTEFANGLCVDSGNSSIGEKILIGGKVIILCLSIPIITGLLDLITAILHY